MMLIVIDYDETYTEDPILWDMFIDKAKERMHELVCCTMRFAGQDDYNADVIADMGRHGIPIVYAASHRDKWDALVDAGYHPENAVWIDDRPMMIVANRPIEDWPE